MLPISHPGHVQRQATRRGQRAGRHRPWGSVLPASGYAAPCVPRLKSLPRCPSAAHASLLSGLDSNIKQFGFASGAEFRERYEIGRFLGQGAFGIVHEATDKRTGERYAVKTITKRRLGGVLEPMFVRRVQHEVDMGLHLGRSLNVAQLTAVYEDEQCVDLVMQLCSGGSLWSRVRRGAYSEADAARIIREVLRAVAQCHSRGVVIRDVKPENFLFADDSPTAHLKLIDLGLGTYCTPPQRLHDRAGSALYCAPEVLKQNYGQKADVWSAGVIAYELLAARLPFLDDDSGDPLSPDLRLSRMRLSNRDIFAAILRAPLDFTGPPWPAISPAAQDLVRRLLTREEAARPTAAEALQHPWLAVPEYPPSPVPGRGGAATSAPGHPRPPSTAVGAGSPAAQSDGAAGSVRDGPTDASVIGPAAPQPLDDTLVQRLQRYGTYARLKQVCLSRVASFMLSDDPMVLTQLAQLLGQEEGQGGRIPYSKVVAALEASYDISPVEARQLLSSFHTDDQGLMDPSEWLAALTDWQAVQTTPEWEELVSRVFGAIDLDQSGEIQVDELEALICNDDTGCPVEDTIPSVLRELQAEVSSSSGSDEEFVVRPVVLPGPGAPSQTTASAALLGGSQPQPAAGAAGAAGAVGSAAPQAQGPGSSQEQWAPGLPGGSAAGPGSGTSSTSGGAGSATSAGAGESKDSAGGFVLDRTAFGRLLRTAQQDRLELFESRRARSGQPRTATPDAARE